MIAILAGCSSATASVPVGPTSHAASPSSADIPSASGITLHLVAIGDSIPYGREDCGGCTTFPTLLAARTASDLGVAVDADNESEHNGLTSPRLLTELRESATLQQHVALGDIVTITIGHNDTPWNAMDDECDADHGPVDGNTNASWKVYEGACLTKVVARYRKDLDAILSEVEKLRAGKPTMIRVTNDYNDVLGDPTAPAEATAPTIVVLNAFSDAACAVAVKHGAVCADTYHAFNGPDGKGDATALLAGDHTHPNADGQQRISDVLAKLGYAPFR